MKNSKLILLLFISFFALTGFYADKPKEQFPASFQVTKGFSNVTGYFKEMDYKINLTEQGTSSISGTAKVASVHTNSSLRDKHLQNKNWFDSSKFPNITIESKKIYKQRNGSFKGLFEVKMKGKSQIIEVPFEVLKNGQRNSLKANFNLSMSTFDIGGGIVSYLVGDKIDVTLNLPF